MVGTSHGLPSAGTPKPLKSPCLSHAGGSSPSTAGPGVSAERAGGGEGGMERCRDLPKIPGRAVAQLGINCISQDCRKIQDRRGLRRSSVIF